MKLLTDPFSDLDDSREDGNVRHFLSSRIVEGTNLDDAIRQHNSHHWYIENGFHWTLDFTFGKDRSRVRDPSSSYQLNSAAQNCPKPVQERRKGHHQPPRMSLKAGCDSVYMSKLLHGNLIR